MRLMGCPKNIDFYKKGQKFINSYTLSFFKNSLHINFSKKLLMKKNICQWNNNIIYILLSLLFPQTNTHTLMSTLPKWAITLINQLSK